MDRDTLLQLRIGIFVLAGIVLFAAFVLAISGQRRILERRYTLFAAFGSAEGLVPGAPVRLAGVNVGNVNRVSFGTDARERRILLELAIDGRFRERIREDSVATISTIGLVGDKIVEITLGSHDRKALPPGDTLRTVEPPDYLRLLAKGEQALESVRNVAVSLDHFVAALGEKETTADVKETIRSLRKTVVAVERGDGLLHGLVYGREGGQILTRLDQAAAEAADAARALKRVAGALEGPADEALGRFTRALASLEAILAEVETGDGLLHALVYDPAGGAVVPRLARLAERLDALAEQVQPAGGELVENLRASSRDLRTVSARLAKGEGTLGALLDDPTIYEDLSALLRGANRSWILRGLIRGSVRRGSDQQSP